MFETYRMLGRARQDELERMATRQGSAVTRESPFVRLLKRISSPRTTKPDKSGQIQPIAPSDTAAAPASAAWTNP
jgi:hypothetical protein